MQRFQEACSSFERISKATVLGMLTEHTVLNTAELQMQYYVNKRLRGKAYADRMYAHYTGLKNGRPGTKEWLLSIPDDNWSIISFDSRTRVVCIQVVNTIGIRNVSITLPYLSASKIGIDH